VSGTCVDLSKYNDRDEGELKGQGASSSLKYESSTRNSMCGRCRKASDELEIYRNSY
jgi:hypothetical protein